MTKDTKIKKLRKALRKVYKLSGAGRCGCYHGDCDHDEIGRVIDEALKRSK